MRRPAKSSSKKVGKDRPRRLSDDGESPVPGRRSSDADLGGNGAVYDDHYGINRDACYMEDCGDGGGWFNCECFLSLVLVGVLVALPFNLHSTKDLLQSRDTYIVKAVELMKVGSCDDAVNLYERALIVEESAMIHHQLADALTQCGRPKEALGYYLSGIRLEESTHRKVPSLMAVGDLFLKQSDYNMATRTFETIVSILQDDPTKDLVEAYMKLAKVDMSLRRLSAAYSHYTAASDLIIGDSMQAEVHYRMGLCALMMGKLPLAIENFKVAAAKGTTSQKSLFTHSLAYAYLEHGMLAQGNDELAALFASPSMYTEERYIRASFQDHQYPSGRSPTQYIAQLFDIHAQRITQPPPANHVDTFRQLHGLLFESGVPNAIAKALMSKIGISDGDHWLDVVDLGCGSGHAMSFLRSLSNFVLGIDLSPLSIENARNLTNMYDDLHVGDFLDVGGGLPDASYDVVVAMNSLPYFGDLRQVFELAHRILRPKAFVAFNVDVRQNDDDNDQQDFSLRFSGRWQHSDEYVKRVLERHGFELLHQEQVEDDQVFYQAHGAQIQHRATGKAYSNVYVAQKVADDV